MRLRDFWKFCSYGFVLMWYGIINHSRQKARRQLAEEFNQFLDRADERRMEEEAKIFQAVDSVLLPQLPASHAADLNALRISSLELFLRHRCDKNDDR